MQVFFHSEVLNVNLSVDEEERREAESFRRFLEQESMKSRTDAARDKDDDGDDDVTTWW